MWRTLLSKVRPSSSNLQHVRVTAARRWASHKRLVIHHTNWPCSRRATRLFSTFNEHQRLFSSLKPPTEYGVKEEEEEEGEEEEELERFPLPEGISNKSFGLFELLNSSKDMHKVEGENAVLAVHGPTEEWAPKGLEEHGAQGGMFAVIGTSGTQYKVMAGDVLYTNRKQGEVNTQIEFDWVLAIGTVDWTVFGRPLIRDAKVLATVEEQTRSGKVMVTKFKKRKGYLKRRGHRQPITRFRIDKIKFRLPDISGIKAYQEKYDPLRPTLPNHLRGL